MGLIKSLSKLQEWLADSFYLASELLSRDTPVTPYTHPPVSTDLATRD